jgi:RNA polymerase sigma-70 factor (ECF subfamily)
MAFITIDSNLRESAVADRFLDQPDEESFTELFRVFTPQLVAFFRHRGHELVLAEDLAQEVMLTVYYKADQVRDRRSFRAWVFKIARNAACRHFAKLTHEAPTVALEDLDDRFSDPGREAPGGPCFEFHDWMAFLEPRERDVMTLRFVEEWEYHEIAAAKAIPIGTVQWRVFNSKKKLAAHLNRREDHACKAA